MSAPMKHMQTVKMKSKEKANKETVTEIKEKVKAFLDDRKNANNLIDVIAFVQSDDKSVVLASVKALHKTFASLISNGHMFMSKPPTEEADLKDLDKEDQYRVWLRNRYGDTKTCLTELLTHDNTNIQELSLCTLMKFLEAEGQHPLRTFPKAHHAFPVHAFEQIVAALLSESHDLRSLLARFQEFLEYEDVRYYAMKCALQLLSHSEQKGPVDVFHQNVYTLFEHLTMPTGTEDTLSNFLCSLPEDTSKTFKVSSLREHKKIFTKVWLDFLGRKLSTSLYKQVLVNLHEKVMPHMTSPLLLADFLTESYNIGGAISLLALNGLFVLINSYNLNYPDFYGKLYALLEPSVFHAKYRARFFFLLDLFLTSTHLPAYLVAAFAKKLSRLALTAPPSGLVIIVPFVFNLLKRHPSCSVLIHRPPSGACDMTDDPFNMEENDPAKCKALDSCLWELKTLQEHYLHSVAMETRKMEQVLPPGDTDLSELLETTVDELIAVEQKRKLKEDESIPVTFDPPKGIFGNKEDQFADLWLLE